MLVTGYTGLFLTAFLAATILPLSSEGVLAALGSGDGFELWGLVLVATAGNTLGSVVNWGLGRWSLRFRDRKWFPVSAATLDRACARFRRWGLWTLLLAWVPVVGDPLTVAAGLLRVPFTPFLVLVAAGKAFRYLVVASGVYLVAF